MIFFPLLMMLLSLCTAVFLWTVRSYNSAVLIGAVGMMCGVMALVVKMSRE